MVDFMSVENRLKQFLGMTKDKDIANFVGLNTGNYSDRKKRGSIPYAEIVIALDGKNADLQWIFYGIESIKKEKSATAYIQYYSDIASSNGNGNVDLLGPYEMVQVDSALFPDADIKNTIAIRVNSTIMSPTIMSQSTVFVDRSKTALLNGKAYLIQIDGTVLLTRMYDTVSGWISRPDNNNYPEVFATEDKIRVIGKIYSKLENIG